MSEYNKSDDSLVSQLLKVFEGVRSEIKSIRQELSLIGERVTVLEGNVKPIDNSDSSVQKLIKVFESRIKNNIVINSDLVDDHEPHLEFSDIYLECKSIYNDNIQYSFNPLNKISNNNVESPKIDDYDNSNHYNRNFNYLIRKNSNNYNYHHEEMKVDSYYYDHSSPSPTRVKNIIVVTTMRDIMAMVISKQNLHHFINSHL